MRASRARNISLRFLFPSPVRSLCALPGSWLSGHAAKGWSRRSVTGYFGHSEVTIGHGPKGQFWLRLWCHMKFIAGLFVLTLLAQSVVAQDRLPKEPSIQVAATSDIGSASSSPEKSSLVPDIFHDSAGSGERSMLASAHMESLVATSSSPAPDSGLSIPPAPQMMLLAKPSQSKVERPTTSARQRRIWMGLMVVEHGAAAVDAWSTRDAIRDGGRELNPLVRPFAHSPTLYPALQVMPLGLDYLSLRLMRSNHHLLRKFWWAPQALSAAASLSCGMSNLSRR